MAIPISALIAGVQLLYEIYNKITAKVIETENNNQITGGEARRIHVEQDAIRMIDESGIHNKLKAEGKRNVRSKIEHDVNLFNEQGIFAHNDKKPAPKVKKDTGGE